jgi:hypothetical protein
MNPDPQFSSTLIPDFVSVIVPWCVVRPFGSKAPIAFVAIPQTPLLCKVFLRLIERTGTAFSGNLDALGTGRMLGSAGATSSECRQIVAGYLVILTDQGQKAPCFSGGMNGPSPIAGFSPLGEKRYS